MNKIKHTIICIVVLCCSFKTPSVKYIYLTEYNTYIRLYSCSAVIVDETIGKRKLVIAPRDNCNSLYIKCFRKPDNFLLEEGLYKCDGTTKMFTLNSRNDNGDSTFKREYYTPKRVGKWTIYKTGKKVLVTY